MRQRRVTDQERREKRAASRAWVAAERAKSQAALAAAQRQRANTDKASASYLRACEKLKTAGGTASVTESDESLKS